MVEDDGWGWWLRIMVEDYGWGLWFRMVVEDYGLGSSWKNVSLKLFYFYVRGPTILWGEGGLPILATPSVKDYILEKSNS
jgi:hypothetical protein